MLQLASPFQHHAILQRDQPLPVWGWASPGARVRVVLGSLTGLAESTADGAFSVLLPALPASGPYALEVTATAPVGQPTASIILTDILIGEVWLASGQSNMQMTLAECSDQGTDAISAANSPEVRFFTTPQRARLGVHATVPGAWLTATPENARSFSATAYHFALRLHRELGVPVGILSSSWGGTAITSWTSRSGLSRHAECLRVMREAELQSHSENRWEQSAKSEEGGRVNLLPRDPGNFGVEYGWAAPTFDTSAWPQMPVPSKWQQHAHPAPGVFWFRREVEIPAAWIGRPLRLELPGIDKQDITYFYFGIKKVDSFLISLQFHSQR